MLRRVTKKTSVPSLYRIAFSPISATRLYSSTSDYSSGEQQYGQQQSSSYQSGNEDNNSGRPQRKPRDYSTSLHVKLPAGASKEKLTEVLNQAGITGVVSVNIPKDLLTETPKSYGFIEFESADAASKAATIPLSMGGQTVQLSPSRSREDSQRYKVYLGDLSFNTKEQDLQSTIENQFGAVEYVKIITHNGASRGHAFVTFKSIEAADAARSAGSFSLDDRVVRVEKVREQDRSRRNDGRGFGNDNQGGFGGRGGFGGNRDGGDSYGNRGGYGGNRDSGYGNRGGYGGNRDGGDSYGSSRGGDRDGSYGNRGGYGGDRDSGYGGGRRNSYDNKESDSDSGYGSGRRSGGGYGGKGSSDSFY